MDDGIIADDVKQFILQTIDSIAQLETLLLLRAHTGTHWHVGDVARRIYISEEEAARLLSQLTAQWFLQVEEHSYRYFPKTPALDQMVGRMADAYSQYLIPVTHLIHSKNRNRMQAFADAFRIRKD